MRALTSLGFERVVSCCAHSPFHMKSLLRPWVLIVLLSLCLPTLVCRAESAPEPVSIVLVGDSTVTDNAGWGLGFRQFLSKDVRLVNTAQGGRSSMSFRTEGRWEKALALKADYYLIQFGHNNEPGKPGRSTDMPTFASDMRAYVAEARAIGATPVLVTPLTRRQWDKARPGRIKSSLAPYAEEVRRLAAELKVPLVDLHARSIELCETLGPDKCLDFSPAKKNDKDPSKPSIDGTHLKGRGRVLFARLVVAELRAAVPALAPVLLDHALDADPQAAENSYDAVVSADGSGTHTTVQAAIDAAPDNNPNPFYILVKPGVYEGQVVVPKTKRYLRLVGEEVEHTIMTYGMNVKESDEKTLKQWQGIGFIVLGDDFSAEKITFRNTSGDHGQALALRVLADRVTFNNCRMLGWQDTLRLDEGRSLLRDCHIEGRVDFIYGSGTAVFVACRIHSKNGGYVTAANTPQDKPFGYVFLDCKLTGDQTIGPGDTRSYDPAKPRKAYLGRPWRAYANVAFVRCELGDHIRAEGWHNWGKVENEKTARFAEYRNTGPGAARGGRVTWARELSDEEAKAYTIENILGGTDGWKP